MRIDASTDDLNRIAEIVAVEEAGRTLQVVEVERALSATGHRPLRDLCVVQLGSILILRGSVPSYHLKQLAQAKAIAVAGIEQVRNEVCVLSKRKSEPRLGRDRRMRKPR